jgi:hypothetical protein
MWKARRCPITFIKPAVDSDCRSTGRVAWAALPQGQTRPLALPDIVYPGFVHPRRGLMAKSIFYFLMAGVLFACTATENNSITTVSVIHKNGLTLLTATDLRFKETGEGFMVYPEGGLERRSPVQAFVSFVETQKPAGEWSNSKSAGGVTVHYKEVGQSGGSGGAEFQLQTWKSCQGGHIKTMQVVQTEQGEPDFSLTWRLISTATRSGS